MSRKHRRNRLCRTAIAIADGERVRASVPPPLPPDPPIALRRLATPLDAASLGVGRLDGIAAVLSATPLCAEPFVDREALLSTQLAGADERLVDLYLDASAGGATNGAMTVGTGALYRRALGHGLARVGAGKPLSPGMLGEVHACLTGRGGGGDSEARSDLRETQIWLDATTPTEATFIPPPPGQIPALMADWERFVHHDTSGLPPLIRAGVAHAQFATIQPFADGNGRMARLIIPLLLQSFGVLRKPMLCPSCFFVRQPALYTEHLAAVRDRGAWEEWLEFFLQGVAETAREVAEMVGELQALFARDRRRVEHTGADLGGVHGYLRRCPVACAAPLAEALGLSQAAADDALQRLEAMGLVQAISDAAGGPCYAYGEYLAVLSRGSDPLPD